MTTVTDAMVSAAMRHLPGLKNPARARKAVEAAVALLPEPAEQVCEIPVTAQIRVIVDDDAFRQSVVEAVHKLRAGLPLDGEGKVSLADLEASLPLASGGPMPPGSTFTVGDGSPDCILGGYPMPGSEPGGERHFAITPRMNGKRAQMLAAIGQKEVRSYTPGIYTLETEVTPDQEDLEQILAALERNDGKKPLLLINALVRPVSITDDELLREALAIQKGMGPLNPVGVTEIASRLGVAKSTVTGWATRRELNGMPAPIWQLASGAVYDLDAVVEWHEKWKGSGATIEGNDGGR